MDASERIAELEIRLTFQDQVIATLNEAVTAQEFRLQALQRQLELLREELRHSASAAASLEPGPQFEVPPHY